MRTRWASLVIGVVAVVALHPAVLVTQGRTSAPSLTHHPIVAATNLADAPSAAYGVSRTGVVVGWLRHHYSSMDVAFRWTADTESVAIGEGVAYRVNSTGLVAGRTEWYLPVPGARVWLSNGAHLALSTGEALDVNEHGQVVGWTWLPTLQAQAFIWDEHDGWKRLGTLVGTDEYYAGSSEARAINDDGVVAGWSITLAGRVHAVSWSRANGFVDLMPDSPLSSAANGINNLGVVIGVVGTGRSTGDHGLAVQWGSDGVERVLDATWGSAAWPTAINDLGQVVGRFLVGDVQHAFLWDGGTGWQDLGPGAAYDINEAGLIAGAAGDGTSGRAVVWRIAPAVQVAALSRTLSGLSADNRPLAAARAHVRQAERLLSRGESARAAERLAHAAEAILRAERHAPWLATVCRSLATASNHLARLVGP